jgi:HTH-type transcriptional regulator/antitoxin HigA
MKRLDRVRPHVLRNEAEYDAAVAEIDALLDRDPAAGTPEHDRLELLTVLVRAYDDDHYPMGETATPQAVIEFLLDQRGMARADLAAILGGRSRVSEFFAGKRRLSIPQIQRLRALLNVPADLVLERVVVGTSREGS